MSPGSDSAARRKREAKRLLALVAHERLLTRAGVTPVAGVDEVGMGPLAGPVVAAAVILPEEPLVEGLDDSKLLTKVERDAVEAAIRSTAIAVGLGIVGPAEIDELNIYQAGLKAMRLAVERLPVRPRHVLVDARTIPGLAVPQTPVVNGDRRIYSIAAASVLAKVYRDRLMAELAVLHPGYGFEIHAGYGTAHHRAALRRLGPSPVHRRSFKLA